jgi:hypothetical protein
MSQPELSAADFPFEVNSNPYAGEADRAVNAWFADRRLIRGEAAYARFRRANYTVMTGRYFPRASLNDLVLCAKWICLGFLADDLFGEMAEADTAVESVAAILEVISKGGSPAGDGPASAALAELATETMRGRSAGWCRRFTSDLCDFYRAFAAEAAYQASGHVPFLADYIPLRRHSVGIGWVLDLAELLDATEVPEELFDTVAWQAMRWATVDVIAYSNDVIGLDREVARGEVTNLVLVLEQDLERREEAIGGATDLIRVRIADYLAAEAEVLALIAELPGEQDRNALSRCVQTHRDSMAGYAHWHWHETSRYTEPETPGSGYAPTYLTSHTPARTPRSEATHWPARPRRPRP